MTTISQSCLLWHNNQPILRLLWHNNHPILCFTMTKQSAKLVFYYDTIISQSCLIISQSFFTTTKQSANLVFYYDTVISQSCVAAAPLSCFSLPVSLNPTQYRLTTRCIRFFVLPLSTQSATAMNCQFLMSTKHSEHLQLNYGAAQISFIKQAYPTESRGLLFNDAVI